MSFLYEVPDYNFKETDNDLITATDELGRKLPNSDQCGPVKKRQDALCCGSSLANTAISDAQQLTIAPSVSYFPFSELIIKTCKILDDSAL